VRHANNLITTGAPCCHPVSPCHLTISPPASPSHHLPHHLDYRSFFDAACTALFKLRVLPLRPSTRQLRGLRRDLFQSVDANEDGVLSFPEVYAWAAQSSHTRELMDGFGVAALPDDDPRKIEVVTRRSRMVQLERDAAHARRRCRRWSCPGCLQRLEVGIGGRLQQQGRLLPA